MTLPTITVRVAPEHQALVRELVAAVRQPGMAERLQAALAGAPAAPDAVAELAARVAHLESIVLQRVTAETPEAAPSARVSRRKTPVTPPVMPETAPDERPAQADLLGVARPMPIRINGAHHPLADDAQPAAPAGKDPVKVAQAARLKEAMKARGLSTRALAEQCGVSAGTISPILSATDSVTGPKGRLVAAFLGVEV